MDKQTAENLLQEIKNQHPDLLNVQDSNKQKKEIYSFKIETDWLERAKTLAGDKSVSNIMRQAVKIGLPQLERQQ